MGNKKAAQRIKATGKVLKHRKIKGINSQCSLPVAIAETKPSKSEKGRTKKIPQLHRFPALPTKEQF